MKAAVVDVTDSKNFYNIVDVPDAGMNDNEVLVKTVAVAVNPTDWKHALYVREKAIGGSDASGYVVNVGSKVVGLEVGDIVSVFKQGSLESSNGTFTEYFSTKPEAVLKFDKKTFNEEKVLPVGMHAPMHLDTFESIAALTLSLGTVAVSLAAQLKILPDKVENSTKLILIWGGATSTGIFAIQVARLVYGLRVITAASKKHEAYLKELGAEAVFDYNEDDVVQLIRDYSQGAIRYGYDCVSVNATSQQLYEATIDSAELSLGQFGCCFPGWNHQEIR